jgi:hypothetical protein
MCRCPSRWRDAVAPLPYLDLIPDGVGDNATTAGRSERLLPIDATLPAFVGSRPMLRQLALQMHGLNGTETFALEELLAVEPSELAEQELSQQPSGLVYFGQFVSHDLAFEPTRGFEFRRAAQRTFALDLDSVYGAGPTADPHLYDLRHPGCLALVCSGSTRELLQYDFVRISRPGLACIEDPRNDENVLVSQLHVAVARAHNALMRAFAAPELGGAALESRELYIRARGLLCWLYQWVVIHDWLPSLLHADDTHRLAAGPLGYSLRIFSSGRPRLTPEYVFGACRFGHAMVRPIYQLNGTLVPLPILPLGVQPDHAHLTLFRRLPDDWFLDWRLFFRLRPSQLDRVEQLRGPLSEVLFGANPNPVQFARRIRPQLSRRLALLPSFRGQGPEAVMLAFRTLGAGVSHGLPSGAALASSLNIHPEVTSDHPLWWWVLEEAFQSSKGERLGRLGSCLVGDTVVGALVNDPDSYVYAQRFTPSCVDDGQEDFGIADLLLLGDLPTEALVDWIPSVVDPSSF